MPLIEGAGISVTAIAFLSALLSLAAFYLYFVFIFRFLSRKFERQADLYAVESTGMPEVFKSSLIRLSAVSYIPRRLPRLIELVRTHPSVFNRLEFVDKVVRGDAETIDYRKPIFHIRRATIVVALILSVIIITNRNTIFPPSEMRYEIGRQYAIDGMIDKAVTEFKEAVRIDPNSEMAHYALGIIYAEKEIMEEAMAELRTVLKINPKNRAARKILSEIDFKERQRPDPD